VGTTHPSVRPDTLRCSTCHQWKEDLCFYPALCRVGRRGRDYYCLQCLGIPSFDHPRPPSMQGRSVSIFTGREPCPPPPIKAEREPSYWSRMYAGAK
jgi:hypothetical protein